MNEQNLKDLRYHLERAWWVADDPEITEPLDELIDKVDTMLREIQK